MKKLLIIRFSSIGDIVLTTPVLRCAKQQTGATIHFLTKKAFKTIVEPNPYLDRVFAIEKKVSEVLPELKREGYSAIIDLHGNLRSRQVKFALNAPSHTFNKINFQKWLMVNLKINRLPETHIVDRYLAAAAAFNVKNDGEGLDYFFENSEAYLHQSIAEKQSGLNMSQAFICLVIGAAHATKQMPEEKIIEVLRAIRLPVVLLGGPAEAALGQKLSTTKSTVFNMAGMTSLDESAFLIKKSALVITPDTGMMHIAAAFQKRIISVWGNTIPAFGMSPYYGKNPDRHHTFEVVGLDCRPCSKIGYARCPKGHFKCMYDQDYEALIRQANTATTP